MPVTTEALGLRNPVEAGEGEAPCDLTPNRAHLLDGSVPETFTAEHAAQYDRWIAADGGLDLQLLGLGRNGHIARPD
jgi:hypothetical protein